MILSVLVQNIVEAFPHKQLKDILGNIISHGIQFF